MLEGWISSESTFQFADDFNTESFRRGDTTIFSLNSRRSGLVRVKRPTSHRKWNVLRIVALNAKGRPASDVAHCPAGINALHTEVGEVGLDRDPDGLGLICDDPNAIRLVRRLFVGRCCAGSDDTSCPLQRLGPGPWPQVAVCNPSLFAIRTGGSQRTKSFSKGGCHWTPIAGSRFSPEPTITVIPLSSPNRKPFSFRFTKH